MTMHFIKPGMLSTFQDMGRIGYQHLGVPTAGPMDRRAHQLANLLVGNPVWQATLEITLTGPTIEFSSACCIAITGADLSPKINDQPAALNRPLILREGDRLSFGTRIRGARAYLAIHGGYQLHSVLNSTSTYLRSAMGGYQGRALKRDDRVELNKRLEPSDLSSLAQDLWNIRIYLPASVVEQPRARIRIIKSNQWMDFTPESCAAMLTETFRISPDSERMGYRLAGPTLSLSTPRQMISEATTFGTIQVPAGGQPIVLMADTQTTGGYPKIAYVASVDLPLLAQMAPGDQVRFQSIKLDEAQKLDAARELAFDKLAQTLQPINQLVSAHII